jgi:hypothetical protein
VAFHSLNEDGSWKKLDTTKKFKFRYIITAGQMPRLWDLPKPLKFTDKLLEFNAANFSDQGNEIALGTIGNASTSEELFFETINAAGYKYQWL